MNDVSRTVRPCRSALSAWSVMLALAAPALAQVGPLNEAPQPYSLDSGPLDNPTNQTVRVFEGLVEVEGAAFLRVLFSHAALGEGSYVRLTSLHDTATQHHDARTLAQWRYSSAYFNGDAVLVELFAGPMTRDNRIAINEVSVGFLPDGGVATQCGPTDDRVISDRAAAGRLMPVGCTATIYTPAGCLVSAGHCMGSGAQIMEFNVPLSDPDGTINHPPPSDQYAVDAESIRATNGGIGNDWSHFVCFENTETGLNVFEAQQDFIPIAAELPDTFPVDIIIWGYGVDSGSTNQAQQRSDGPLLGIDGSPPRLRHRADTQGGNSGSAIVLAATDEILGIHTHGGCDESGDSWNSGTPVNNDAFAQARRCPSLGFTYPDGLVIRIDPATGAVLRVLIEPLSDAPREDGVTLEYSVDGGPFQSVSMTSQGGDLYEGAFPPVPCGSRVAYYVRVETQLGDVVTDPLEAPADTYSAASANSVIVAIDDDFEADLGWESTFSGSGTTGQWVRVDPIGTGAQPEDDYSDDGTRCYVTGNCSPDPGECDVDGGPVVLTSPLLDLSGGNLAWLGYARWFYNDDGDDPMTVQISNDNGQTWVSLEDVGPGGLGGWVTRGFFVNDFLVPTDQMLVRFATRDSPNNSITEAAVDEFVALLFDCAAGGPPGDFDGDGDVDIADFGFFTACFTGSGVPCAGDCCEADLDGDGDVDIADFAIFTANFTGSQ